MCYCMLHSTLDLDWLYEGNKVKTDIGEGILFCGYRHPAELLCKQQPGAVCDGNSQTSRTHTDSQHEGPRGGCLPSVSHEPDCAENYRR